MQSRAVVMDSCMCENLVWSNSEGKGSEKQHMGMDQPLQKSCPYARTKMCSGHKLVTHSSSVMEIL